MNKDNRIKLTKDVVEDIFVNHNNWTKETDFGVYHYYRSPCKRYVLQESEYSNLADPYTETGWNMHIDNSDMMSLASCDVEFVDQVDAIISIYKEY